MDAQICQCSHAKSDHDGKRCVKEGCDCDYFRTKHDPVKQSTLNKTVKGISGFTVDSKKLLKLNKPAGKSGETKKSQGDIRDSIEHIFTEISELGSDYKQKIDECDKVLKNDQASDREILKAWITKGRALRQDDRAAESLPCFAYVLLKDEKNIIALKEKAMSHEDLGEFYEALKCYEDLLKIDGQDDVILNRIAICYCDQKMAKYDKAISYLEQVLAIDDKNNLALSNMGFCYEQKGENRKALLYFSKNVSSDFSLMHKANLYFEEGDDDDAFDAVQKLIKLGKADYWHYYIAGENLRGKKKYDEAIAFLVKSLIREESANAYCSLGYCYAEIKREDLAILYYEKGLDKNIKNAGEKTYARINLGLMYSDKEEYELALKHFEIVLKNKPKNTRAFQEKLFVLQEMGKNDEVASMEIPKEFENAQGVCQYMTYASYEVENFDQALEYAQKALEIEKSGLNYVWLGWVLQALERNEEAKQCYDDAIKLEPEYAQGYEYMGRILSDEKNHQGSFDYYKKAWEISKHDDLILEQGYEMDELGKKIRREGNEQLGIEKLKDGIAILEPILESRECGGKAWLETGRCYWNLSNFVKAEECYLKASEILPEDAEGWRCLGDVRCKAKSYSEALIFYERSLLYDNTIHNVQTYYEKGMTYYELEEWSKAIESYNEVLRLNNNFEDALFYKANSIGALKEYEAAIDCYVNFIDQFKNSYQIIDVWKYKAWTENMLSKYDDALDSCRQALKLTSEIEYKTKPTRTDGVTYKPKSDETLKEEKIEDVNYILYEQGAALRGLEQFPDALECYKKLLVPKCDKNHSNCIGTKNIWILRHIITCLGKLDRIDEQKDYRRKLRDHENDDDLPA